MKYTTIPKAFQSLCPDCDVNYNSHTLPFVYEDAEWLATENNLKWIKPTKEEIFNEIYRLDLIEAKKLKKQEIDNNRDILKNKSIEYTLNGIIYNFQRDIQSQLSFVTAISATYEEIVLKWITEENHIVDVTKEDLINICVLIKNRDTAIYLNARNLKDHLFGLNSILEIENLN